MSVFLPRHEERGGVYWLADGFWEFDAGLNFVSMELGDGVRKPIPAREKNTAINYLKLSTEEAYSNVCCAPQSRSFSTFLRTPNSRRSLIRVGLIVTGQELSFAFFIEACFKRCMTDREVSRELSFDSRLQVLECFERALPWHEMSLQRTLVLANVPDVHVMDPDHAIGISQGLDDLVELDIVRNRPHQESHGSRH